jgi:hypothetical protein
MCDVKRVLSSIAEIVGSNPVRGMNVRLRSVFVFAQALRRANPSKSPSTKAPKPRRPEALNRIGM